jgi:hypothetical protein
VTGKLQADKGQIDFKDNAGKNWPLDQIQQVRFAESTSPPPRMPLTHRLMLSGEHWLSGELLAMDETMVHFRAWTGKELKIPRKSLFAIAQPGDWQVLSRESFEKEPAGWTFSEPKALRADLPFTGKKSLILDQPGQDAKWSSPNPLAAGRVSLFLRQSDDLKDQELHIGWSFRKGKENSRWVEMRLDGTKFFVAKAAESSLKTTAGWHLLQMDISPATVRISVDGLVLHSEPGIADSVLTGMKLAVTAKDKAKTAAGFWSVDDVQFMRLEKMLPWPKAMRDADTIWLPEGDQIFAKVVKADTGSVTFEGRFGTRTLAWPAVRGIVFMADQRPAKEAKVDDAFTLWVAPSPGFPADRTTGTLLSLSPETLALRHAMLGDLSFDRKNCVKLLRCE